MTYRLWLNAKRTILVRLWEDGRMEIAMRVDPDHVWGPPIQLEPEKR